MGLPVAVPAATSAFGATATASMVTPALMSATSVAAPLAAANFTGSFVPSLLTSSSGGGFFSNMFSGAGGLLKDASVMDLAYGATQGLSFIQSVRQGQIMKDQYKIQELQALTDMERMKYNATLEGLDRLDKLRRIQAANTVKSFAGGVEGLSGSALLTQITSDQQYGKDYKINLNNLLQVM